MAKSWPRDMIRALKSVDAENWWRVNETILDRLVEAGLMDKIEYYELTEYGEEVLNEQ